ncbi:cyclase family protein [Paenarthrobacter ureafaciens]|uniref:cyclase family protein n=1 Tax=Paenarthrobacter ureafaciens TaxID=37931 RepID=UPI002DB9F188|nr:cyclase family protein [Paenarthrobacter ureafaciens]MEC3853143.1 cyclase family protein [Paenarthrobacter ureafaciens]
MSADNRVGPYKYLTPEKVLNALSLVHTGQVINLDLPQDNYALAPTPQARPVLAHKQRMFNEVRPRSDGSYVVVNDDVIEFAPQGSSHWDALAHWGAIEPGDEAVFAGGRTYEETFPEFGAKTLGIDALSGGVVTRGVLLDLVGFMEDGAPYLSDEKQVNGEDIVACLEHQGIQLHPGDAVLLYTGFHKRQTDCGFMREVDGKSIGVAPGLSVDSLDVFLEAGVFALISDNPSVESNPMNDGRFHTLALKHGGIYLGELWDLDGLREACREDSRWEFLLMSSPMYVRGAFGSPANALAIR